MKANNTKLQLNSFTKLCFKYIKAPSKFDDTSDKVSQLFEMRKLASALLLSISCNLALFWSLFSE